MALPSVVRGKTQARDPLFIQKHNKQATWVQAILITSLHTSVWLHDNKNKAIEVSMKPSKPLFPPLHLKLEARRQDVDPVS